MADKELYELSNSRAALINKCGKAFEYQYVDQLPAPFDTGAKIFGHAIHDGLAEWYGAGPTTDGNRRQHQELDLPTLVDAQWERLLPPAIWEQVESMLSTQVEADAVAEAILLARPELKAVRQTQAYRTSDVVKKLNEQTEKLLELCDKCSEMQWPSDENPIKAYNKAHAIAERLQNEWKEQPRPLLVEQGFRLEFGDFILHGRLDQLRQDIDTKTGELLGPALHDTKTGRNLYTQMEAFLQAFIYVKAVEQMEDVPDVSDVVFDFVRHVTELGQTKRQRATIDLERHEKLATRILNGAARTVISADYHPNYGFWCTRCDFKDLCEKELGLWEGDGV